MILRSMTVEGFRSIQNPETLHLDRKVTTIAGGNDHGKSNVLTALKFLMKSNEFATGDLCRASQAFADGEEFPHIRYEFSLDANDAASITKHVRNSLGANAEATKAAADAAAVTFEAAVVAADAATAKKVAAEAAATNDEVEDAAITDEVVDALAVTNPVPVVDTIQSTAANAAAAEKIVAEARAALETARSLAENARNLPWLENIKEGMKVMFARKGVGKPLELIEPAVVQEVDRLFNAIYEVLPNVELVEGFPQIRASITLEKISEPENEVMQGIVKMAGLWNDREVVFNEYDSNPQARKLFSTAKDCLNKALKRAWAQGESYDYQINMSGGTLHFDISDQTGHHDVPAVRGLGLRSFLEFHLTLLSRTGEFDPQGYIFAFDEPGPHLHPQGQKDLLRIIEQLAAKNQIVYVTHSLFLVNRNYPQRTVLVTKNEGGTHIAGKPFLKNWRPLLKAIGVTPADTLYYADKVLLVEGESDRIYLYAVLSQIANDDKSKLDLNQFAIRDMYEDNAIVPYLNLMHEEGMMVTVMFDNDDAGRKKADRAKKWAAETGVEVGVVELSVKRGKELAIEDILPRSRYLHAVSTYIEQLVSEGVFCLPDDFDLGSFLEPLGKDEAQSTVARRLAEKLNQDLPTLGKISKVGIARVFVQIMADDDALNISMPEWEGIRTAAERAASTLNLRPKAEFVLDLEPEYP